MNRLFLAMLVLVLSYTATISQEKISLSHDDYDKWEVLSNSQISDNGRFVMYNLDPQREDGRLFIRNISSGEDVVVQRGAKSAFSPGNQFAVFHIEPYRSVVRQAKVDKKKPDEMPKDTLGIFLFNSDDILTYSEVNSYQLPKEPSDWLAFSVNFERVIEEKTEEEAEQPTDTVPEPAVADTTETKKPKTEKVKQLVILNPVTGAEHKFEDVTDYTLSENGRAVMFVQYREEKEDTLKIKKLWRFDTSSVEVVLLDSLAGEFKQLNISKNGEMFAWLFSADTTDTKVYDLYFHQPGRREVNFTVTVDSENMPEGYAVSEHQKPSFSDDNSRVFFGVAPRPVEEPEDTLLKEEKYSVDVWHWQDPLLQTQQKLQLRREQQRNFDAVMFVRKGNIVPLTDEKMPSVSADRYSNSEKFMGSSDVPYQMESSWLGRTPRDIYVVDVETGNRTLVLERALSSVQLSVVGSYIVLYDPETEHWYSIDTESNTRRNITSSITVPLFDETNDVPADAWPHGIAGWGKDDAYVLIYDRYDIWKVDPAGKLASVNLTKGEGRKNSIRFRYQNLDRDEYHIPEDIIYLSAFNDKNKKSGYYRLDMKSLSLDQLVMEEASYMQLQKSKSGDVFTWRRSTFTEYPDLWVGDDSLTNGERISEANPWQDNYLWGSVQLVEWQDFKNDTLQGLLYLPGDFDSSKKYPMIVYFYERTSDRLHNHSIPSPSRSTINPSYCTSNGYIVFMPDITYDSGYPGRSAYNSIVSGTQAMTERYPFIDRERMALQGQSWGGYQIAYLVTRTDMFRAAMAGAPVSNMTSAYGGIRWGSGMVRQFQYEQSQSRIGGTLWDKPMHYIENSPVFYVPDINTPLLIMHNDDDGAVPWYQSIELFTAMRRLQKPAWLLVYNGEAHNLVEWPARMDLSMRMYQFFDHYLKDAPAPRWMKEGIPYIDKGKVDGYELME